MSVATTAAALGPLYNFFDLGVAGQNSYATDVNGAGVVSGGTWDANGDWDQGLLAHVTGAGEVVRTFVAPPAGSSGLTLTGVNIWGDASGTTVSAITGHTSGVIYGGQGNAFLSIPTIVGAFPYSDVYAAGINDSYEVTGYMRQTVGQDRYVDAYLYNPSFGSLRLSRLGGTQAFGVGLNGYGAVVGYGDTALPGSAAGDPTHGLIYYPGIGSFDVSAAPTGLVGLDFYLSSINNHNVAVGSTTGLCNSCIQPIVYDNGATIIVNTLGAYVDINDNGLIVGETANGVQSQAFLVDGSGRYRLSDLIVGANFGPNIRLGSVSAVNALGDIVGTAEVTTDTGTEQHAFLMTPYDAGTGCLSCGGGGGSPPGVPEPAAWTMMILGIGLTGGLLRRRVSPRGAGVKPTLSRL